MQRRDHRLAIATAAPAPMALLTAFSTIGTVRLTTGSGNDSVAILQAPTAVNGTLSVSTGAGNDTVSIQALAPTTLIDLGSGNDEADQRATTRGAALTLSGNSGSDRINLLAAGAGSTITIDGDQAGGATTSGDGADTVYVAGEGIDPGARVVLHGQGPTSGTPGDKLLYDPQGGKATTSASFETLGSATTAGYGTITADGFESESTLTGPTIVITMPDPFAEGTGVSVTASVLPNGTTGTLAGPVVWDISGHGNFGEVTGSTITLSWAQLNDPGLSDTHTATISWGDGTTSAAAVDDAHDTFTAQHQYLNNLVYVNGVPGVYRISATLLDKDGGSNIGTTQQTVDNVAPTLVASMTTPTPTEFNVVSITGHVTDPGTQDVETLQIVWGDGSSGTETLDPMRNFTVTHTYAELLPSGQAGVSHTIVLTDSDDVTSTSLNLPITLAAGQVAVTSLTASPGLVAEGSPTTLSGTFTDNAPNTTHTVTLDFGDGTTAAATVNEATGTYTSSHVYANNPGTGTQGTYTVTATAGDSLGLSGQAAAPVVVADVAPSLTGVTLDVGAIAEGGSVTVSGQVVDPGVNDAESVTVVWGDGSSGAAVLDPVTRLFSATHLYVDNPVGQPNGAFVIGLTATDDSGLTGTASTDVTVANVAPTVLNLVVPTSAMAGNTVVVTGSVTDPGVKDTEAVSVDWGDGTQSAGVYDAAKGTFVASHVYAAGSGAQPGGTFLLVATATDKDGGQGSASSAIAVAPIPVPVPVLSGVGFGATAIKEGDTVALSGTFADAAAGDTLTVAWGDGQTSAYLLTAAGAGFSVSHVYANNPAGQPTGSYTAMVSLSDGTDPASTGSASVVVANVAPGWTSLTNTSSSTAKTPVGQNLVLYGAFTDPGVLDTHTVTIGWGDGTKASTYTMSAGLLSFDYGHVFAKVGSYYVTVQVTDSDGAVSGYKASFAYVGPAVPGYVAPPPAMVADTPAAGPPPATVAPIAPVVMLLTPTPAPAVTASSAGKTGSKTVMSALAVGSPAEPLITLIKSSQVRLAVNAPRPMVVPPKPATLVFDPETGELTDAGAMPVVLASIDLGEDWMFLPAYTPTAEAA